MSLEDLLEAQRQAMDASAQSASDGQYQAEAAIAAAEVEYHRQKRQAREARKIQSDEYNLAFRKLKDSQPIPEDPFTDLIFPLLPKAQEALSRYYEIRAACDLGTHLGRAKVENAIAAVFGCQAKEEKDLIQAAEEKANLEKILREQENWHPRKISVFKGAKKYCPELLELYEKYCEEFSIPQIGLTNHGKSFSSVTLEYIISEFTKIKHPRK